MIVYVVARPLMRGSSLELVDSISCIEVPPVRVIPVVAVGELHNLPGLIRKKKRDVIEGVVQFSLDDFRNERQQAALDQFTVDINLLIYKMEGQEGRWIFVDFGNELVMNVLDFIRKFSGFIFLSEKSKNSKFVFLVDRRDVAFYAGRVNESVNNISISPVKFRKEGGMFSFYMGMYGVILARLVPGFILSPLRWMVRRAMHVMVRKDLAFQKRR